MIWIKTDAGRHEMQARALVKERARRNLLLVIDGVTAGLALAMRAVSVFTMDTVRGPAQFVDGATVDVGGVRV